MIHRTNRHDQRAIIGFTLVEIMVIVLIIGIILAIALPNFFSARDDARSRACIDNLKQIDTGKQQWMMDNKSNTFASFTIAPGQTTTNTLYPNYLKSVPQCQAGGTYTTNDALTIPTCSIGYTATVPHVLT